MHPVCIAVTMTLLYWSLLKRFSLHVYFYISVFFYFLFMFGVCLLFHDKKATYFLYFIGRAKIRATTPIEGLFQHNTAMQNTV